MKYPEAEDGEWFNPKHRGFIHICCDCHAAHSVDFKIVKGDIWTRWNRLKKMTRSLRRKFKFEKEDE